MSGTRTITVRVPLSVRKRRGRKMIVTPDGEHFLASGSKRAHPAMVKALARAFRWKRMLDDGRYGSISEIAAAEKIDRGYLGSILRLTLLAPDIIEAILNGNHPPELGLPALLKPFPVEWDQQRTKWSVAIRRSPNNTEQVSPSNDDDDDVCRRVTATPCRSRQETP